MTIAADTNNDTSNERIEALRNKEIILSRYLQALRNANKWDYFAETKSFSLVPLAIESLGEALIAAEKRGIKLRFITEITKDNISSCRNTMKIAELKQLEGVHGNFAVSDTEYIATNTVTGVESHSITIPYAIYSNVNEDIKQQQYVFEILWNKAIPAEQKISEIEEGARARELYLDLVKSAAKEVLLVFATTGAFLRQQKMGVIQLCQEAAKERNVRVRILMPANESTGQTVQDVKQNYSEHIDVRYIEQTSGTKATILLVDRKVSLVMELRDDSTRTFEEAIGLSTYSNSRPGVLSYISIFENLWMEAELYKQVKEANERLTLHDKMQQEFINVAAHELRTPIQPILTMVGLLHSTKGHVNSQQMDDSLEMIRRNAQRLKRLAEDILDVTKIETQSLILHKEQLNLNDIVVSAIRDVKNQIQYNSVSGGGVQILYESKGDDTIFIEADRYRVAQLVTNLLSNALKFLKQYDELVSISIEKIEDVVGGRQEIALVSVRDNGTGIDADIFPRLFEKFASGSFKGTGLGLFICKSIVEAHGGRIWAENRVIAGENGATFYFTLPILLR